jgi:hypothetical protein
VQPVVWSLCRPRYPGSRKNIAAAQTVFFLCVAEFFMEGVMKFTFFGDPTVHSLVDRFQSTKQTAVSISRVFLS